MKGKAKGTRLGISRSRRAEKSDLQAQTKAGAAGTPMASVEVTPEERHQLIAVTAYFLSERRGFSPGLELQDWLEAETRIDSNLGGRQVR